MSRPLGLNPPNTMPSTAPMSRPAPLPPMIRSAVQVPGLPARSSRRVRPSWVPVGDSLDATARVRASTGATSRSMAGRSDLLTSRWLMVFSMSSRDRATPVVWPAPEEAAMTMVTSAPAMATRPTISSMVPISDLHIHDFAHPEDTDAEGDQPSRHHHETQGTRPEQLDVLPIGLHRVEENSDRQADQDVGRETSFRGQCPH